MYFSNYVFYMIYLTLEDKSAIPESSSDVGNSTNSITLGILVLLQSVPASPWAEQTCGKTSQVSNRIKVKSVFLRGCCQLILLD